MRKNAFTVVELIVTIGVFSILMTLVTQLTLAAMRVTDQIRLRADVQQAAFMVNELLRRDVRSATRVTLKSDGLKLEKEDGTWIEYRWAAAAKQLLRSVDASGNSETDASKSKPRSLHQDMEIGAKPIASRSVTPAKIEVPFCSFTRVDPDTFRQGGGLMRIHLTLSHLGPGGGPPITYKEDFLVRTETR